MNLGTWHGGNARINGKNARARGKLENHLGLGLPPAAEKTVKGITSSVKLALTSRHLACSAQRDVPPPLCWHRTFPRGAAPCHLQKGAAANLS